VNGCQGRIPGDQLEQKLCEVLIEGVCPTGSAIDESHHLRIRMTKVVRSLRRSPVIRSHVRRHNSKAARFVSDRIEVITMHPERPIIEVKTIRRTNQWGLSC
jgi:hypothetical protein